MKKDYLPLSGNIAAAVSVAAAHHNADYTMHIQWAELRPWLKLSNNEVDFHYIYQNMISNRNHQLISHLFASNLFTEHDKLKWKHIINSTHIEWFFISNKRHGEHERKREKKNGNKLSLTLIFRIVNRTISWLLSTSTFIRNESSLEHLQRIFEN